MNRHSDQVVNDIPARYFLVLGAAAADLWSELPQELQHQLFEPGVSSKTGGWGIGLALARRIVEQQHGGRVSFRPSAQGKGSVFVLEFPLT